jgi:RimJ/RimL family protein N-acetyltransferase
MGDTMHKMLVNLPELLETERLALRPYRAGDGLAYFEVCQRNREHLHPFEADNPALSVQNVEQAEILVRQFVASWAARTAFFWGAWAKDNREFVAQLYVGPVDWELPEFEIGYFVDVDHEGQGYVTEAVNGMLRFLFVDVGAHRVRISCNELNVRSWRLAERCGFTREGYLRQTRNHILREDGTYSGDYLYGLLQSEYESR